MDIVKDFLLQAVLITIPMLGLQLPLDKKKKALMALLWGMALIICMYFPVYYGLDYRLDLRVIPLLLGFLYGGYAVGGFLTAI